MKKGLNILITVLIVLLIGVFSYSAYKLLKDAGNYKKADDFYKDAASQFVTQNPAADAPGASPAEALTPSAPAGMDGFNPGALQELSPVVVDFEALRSVSADIRAWLYCADTPLNYPVVYNEDNDYYLSHLMDGRYNPSGTLYIDARCRDDFSCQNTVIHGHHMHDGSMLASITKYADQAYYDEHPVLYLNTPDGNYRLELFAGFVTLTYSLAYTYDFDSTEAYLDWLVTMKELSNFQSDVEVGADDHIVTFSTCSYEYDDARYVLMGKLVTIG